MDSTPEQQLVYIALDDAMLAEQVACQAACFGYQTNLFTSASTFCETVKLRQPDVIIIDIDFNQQPLQGAHLVEELQQSLQADCLATVFISASAAISARLAAVRAHGKAFLTTPVDMSQLLETLETLTLPNQTQAYRILVVEDSRAQAYFISTTLNKAGMLTEVVHEPYQIMQTLVEFRPELILMDIYLPNCSGLELAHVIRQQEAYVSVPIVFLSAEHNLNRQLKALTLGGDDFLTKPISPEHLISAVESRAARSRILRSYMIRDSLTGLLNHTSLLEYLEIEISRCSRQKHPLCFAMIDIDHFKHVNDRYGHPVGDKVIKSLSHLLQQRFRKTDTIGRYGGEEFAVILPNTQLAQAHTLLQEIRHSFAELRQFAGEHEFHATLSAGVAFYECGSANQLTDCADRALYQAKKAGRNCITVHCQQEAIAATPPSCNAPT